MKRFPRMHIDCSALLFTQNLITFKKSVVSFCSRTLNNGILRFCLLLLLSGVFETFAVIPNLQAFKFKFSVEKLIVMCPKKKKKQPQRSALPLSLWQEQQQLFAKVLPGWKPSCWPSNLLGGRKYLRNVPLLLSPPKIYQQKFDDFLVLTHRLEGANCLC